MSVNRISGGQIEGWKTNKTSLEYLLNLFENEIHPPTDQKTPSGEQS